MPVTQALHPDIINIYIEKKAALEYVQMLPYFGGCPKSPDGKSHKLPGRVARAFYMQGLSSWELPWNKHMGLSQ